MEYTRKTFAEFFGSPSVEVANRDPLLVVPPPDEIGFRFYEVLTAAVEIDGFLVELVSRHFKVSNWFFLEGLVMTFEQAQAELMPDIPEKMRRLGWNRIILFADGHFANLERGDVLLSQFELG